MLIQRAARKRTYILALTALLVFSALSAISLPVSGQGIVDQQCTTVGQTFLASVGNNYPAGQLFSPNQTSIVGFAVNILSTSDQSRTMTARILQGGITGDAIGSVTFSVPGKYGGTIGAWLRIDISSGIPVIPGNTYALDLAENKESTDILQPAYIKWTKCADNYLNGSGYANGAPFPDGSDLTFITYAGDYSLTVSPTRASVTQGSFGNITVTITSISRFASPVDLSIVESIPGVTSSFAPNPITPTIEGTVNSILTLSIGANVATGSYEITIMAESGALSHTAKVTLTVTQTGAVPDFTIAVSATSISIVHGTSTTLTTTVKSLSTFTSAVYLGASNTPKGLNVSFAPNPIIPAQEGTVSSVTTMTVDASTDPGLYSVTITGISVALSHSVTLSVDVEPAAVPDFSIKASEATVSLAQGSIGTATITVTSLNSFNSAVDLSGSWIGSAPAATLFSLPSPITPPSGGTATSTLTITAGSISSAGTFTLGMTGTSGALSHSINIEVHITTVGEDFTIDISPSSLSLTPGSSSVSTITAQSIGPFSSPIALATSDVPAGVTITFSSNTITPPAGGTISSVATVAIGTTATPGTYNVTITGSSGKLSRSDFLTIQITSSGGRCLIATATYGSELSPEVQFLRSFRDNSIMKTHAGSDFMVVFNAWYYSFSPSVADYLTTHQAERTIMKGLLYPLLAILFLSSQVFSATDFNPELASVLAGLVASSLIGAFYIALPITLLRTKMHRLRGPRLQRLLENSLEVAILGEFIVFILGETFTSTILLMMSSAAIVLSTLSLSAAFISARIAEKLQSN
jgi:uncharacterized membrane protein